MRRSREFWIERDGRGSYSRTMTPDVVVKTASNPANSRDRLVVLDAKYRIDDGLNEALRSRGQARDESGGTEDRMMETYGLACCGWDFIKEKKPGREAGLKF
jgi:hypothetical protein